MSDFTDQRREALGQVTDWAMFNLAEDRRVEFNYLKYWAPEGGKHGLDLGCGRRGTGLKWITRVDLHQGEWTTAVGKTRWSTSEVVADISDLSWVETESQDYVISSHVLEHFRHPDHVIPEWIRVLRPGGRLGIVVPDATERFSWEGHWIGGRNKGEDHLCDHTPWSMIRYFEEYREYLRFLDMRRLFPGVSFGVIFEKKEEHPPYRPVN